MSFFRQLTRGLRTLGLRRVADEELADEVRHFLDQATADLVQRGHSPAEARRAVHAQWGNPTTVSDEVRSYGWENRVASALADIRLAWRRLRGNPGHTTISVLTLALGIGASTAIFSAVNPILFQPLPYPNASRVVSVWYGASDGSRASQTYGTFRELEARARTFDAMAVAKSWQPTLIGTAEPERLEGQRVTAGYFRVLGVRPAFGRDFDVVDDQPGGARPVVLSDALWRRRFAGDRGIVGQSIRIDDENYTVAGVLPPTFENVLDPPATIWTLLQYDPALPAQGREWGHHLSMIARVKDDLTVDAARRELAAIASTPIAGFARQPGATMDHGLVLNALQDDVTRGVRPALLAVLSAVIVVLIIACVNVTNLLLARGVQRRGEFAMRAALGASRGRLIRQLLTESMVLAMSGGLLGLVVAELGVRALVSLSPPEMPRLGAIAVQIPAFVFAFGVSATVGAIVGLLPALTTTRGELHLTLQETTHRAVGGMRAARSSLVVAEVALAVVLLAGAGLLLRSLERLFALSPGFDASHLLTMQVQLSSRQRFPDDRAARRFYDDALRQVQTVPGVVSAAFTSEMPMSGDGAQDVYGVSFELAADQHETHDAYRYAVTPGYFHTMGIPLRHGRSFDAADMGPTSARPVLISESLARRTFPGRDPIGQRLRFAGPADRAWDEIVGVVGDVRQMSLAATDMDAVYVTTGQWLWADTPQWLVVRARGDAAALAAPIRRAIWSVDKDQPISRVAVVDDLIRVSQAQRRFALVVFETFGLMALVLAAIGIYGVLSGSVNERRREVGVRAALGASRGDILGLVLRQGMSLAGTGVVIGVVVALIASDLLTSLLFGISRLDAITYVGVVLVIAGVAGAACWIPALRAARVHPASALRAE